MRVYGLAVMCLARWNSMGDGALHLLRSIRGWKDSICYGTLSFSLYQIGGVLGWFCGFECEYVTEPKQRMKLLQPDAC